MARDKIELPKNGTTSREITDDASVVIVMKTDTIGEHGTSTYHLRDIEEKPERTFQKMLSKLRNLYMAKRRQLILGIKIVLALLYFAYFGYAVSVRFGDEGSWRLTAFTIFGICLVAYRILGKIKVFTAMVQNIRKALPDKKLRKICRWFLYVVALVSIGTYLLIFVVRDHPENLISLIGLVVFILGLFLTSTNLSKVNWHTVFWGLTIQFYMAIFFLNTKVGIEAMDWATKRFEEFTEHADAGSEIIFGPDFRNFRFIFQIRIFLIIGLTFIVLVDVLTYLGVTHFLTSNVGGLLAFCMGTKASESMVAVANIFLGDVIALLLAREEVPYISLSQVFCMVVSGLSSMSGVAMLAFQSFGVPIKYMLIASVLSAPAALVSAKISLPEQDDDETLEAIAEKRKHTGDQKVKPVSNIFEVMSDSLKRGGKIISTIILSVILYVALGSFVDSTLQWFGERINLKDLTFQRISSYVFWPLAYIMGASPTDCGFIAEQIGVRTLINAALAYINFGQLIRNRESYMHYSVVHNDTIFQPNGDVLLPAWNSTLSGGFISERSEIIGVYSVCGFASFQAIGMFLGVFQTIAPNRLKEMSTVIFRSYMVSTVASFITACIAGLVYV